MTRVLLLAALITAITAHAFAADAPRTVWSGVYTTAQAKQGKALYLFNCAAACHVENLAGNGPAPSLAGEEFRLRWQDFSLAELFNQTSTTMPKAAPGALSSDEYVAVIAFILSANGYPSGAQPLPGGTADLDRSRLPARHSAERSF